MDWLTIASLEKRGKLPDEVARPAISMSSLECVFFFNDEHTPYGDEQVFKAILMLIQDLQPDRIVENGDGLDFYSISSFSKDPRRQDDVHRDIVAKGDKLEQVRLVAPDAIYDYTVGNHEERFERYLIGNAPALINLPCLELPNLLDVKGRGITFHQAEGFALRPHFHVYHGTIVSKHSGNSAKLELEKWGVSGISGHTHRADSYHKTDVRGTRGWTENGCVCKLEAPYIKGTPNWRQVVTIGWFDRESDFYYLEQVPIHKGRILYRGKVYG